MQWSKRGSHEFGVICGAEKSQEWMLPWWWSRYRDHNDFPVTFIDFGMTDEMRSWCAERGSVCSVEFNAWFVCSRENIEAELARLIEEKFGRAIWDSRRTWFKKPFAFLHSPYKVGLWLDIDCEVLGPLKPLFSCLDHSSELALVRNSRDHLPHKHRDVWYNGGVIVFRHGAPIIEKWAEAAMTQNHEFVADDILLSHLIHQHDTDVIELPKIYNWRLECGVNSNAVIFHWVGSVGKQHIRKHALNSLPRSDTDQIFRDLE